MTYFVDDKNIKAEAYDKIAQLVEDGGNYADIVNVVSASQLMIGVLMENGEVVDG